MITGQLSAEISATCSSLGHFDGLTYNVDPYCKESIKDLIRYLRRDSEDHAVRRFLGSSKLLKTDLVPIMVHHSNNDELFDVVLRLVMNLTTPALIVYQEQIPSDKTERNQYLQLISQLQDGKQAFTEPEVWNVLVEKIGKLLETESYERDEDTSRTMERILILARNVLAVPSDADYERRPDNDVTVHDKVLWAMHKSRLDEIFLYIASSEKEQQVYMHVLEIIALLLREQNPSTLAKSEAQRSFTEKERDEEELLAFRQAEIRDKQMKVKKYAGARHGRFGGTYVMMGVKAAGDKDLIFHKPLDKAVSMEFNFEKKRIKWPKNLQPLKQVSEERKSTFAVRLFLKEFCVDLLNGAYNPLMRRVKDIIERGKSNGDESYYFWAMKFFMEFNRNHNFQVKLVSETVSVETFHFIQTQLENWNDLMTTDIKKIPLWSRRMHLALNAYQELLLTLAEMDKSPDEACKSSSRVLKSRVFYVTEYRDLLVILVHLFKKNRFSVMYMKDMIETVHIFMKMLQKFSEKHRGGLVVQQRKRVVKRKKKTAGKSGKSQEANMESIWDQVGPQLSAVLQNNAEIPNDVVPFDAVSDLSMDEQKVEAMKKIQSLLKNGNFEEAIGLLRSAREVWPENNHFGAPGMQPEDEFMAVREIFIADLGQGVPNQPGGNENEESDDEENEEEYGDGPSVGYQESELKFDDFVRRFISEKTLQICSILLAKFEQNSVHTNHCIIKLLHRIAVDCHMPAMMFQASLFRVFQRAMSSPNPDHKELRRFGRFIVQKFLEVAEKNSKVFIELLFWKKVKDAIEVVDGYGTTSVKGHAVKNIWTEEQEDELTRLCNEFMSSNPPESNPVDWIMQNLINQDRSRVSVVKKLKEMHLWSKETMIEMKRSARQWSQEEVDQLKELVPQFLEAENPMECIMSRLIGNRSKNNVIRKILDLGIVSDKKELRKKRARKSRGVGKSVENSSSSEGSSSDDEDLKKKERKKEKKVFSFDKAVEAIHDAISNGLKEPLEWLASSLTEMLDDLEAEEAEDVPLLPLTENCTLAMENTTFISVIQALGIKSPDDQEIYWRIPGDWNEMKIRENVQLIKDGIEGKLIVVSRTDDEQKKGEHKTKKRAKRNEKESFKNILDNLDRSENDSNSDMENNTHNTSVDSGSNSEATPSSARHSSRQSNSEKRRKLILDSDSTDDDSIAVNKTPNDSVLEASNSKKSGSEFSQGSKRNHLSSDQSGSDSSRGIGTKPSSTQVDGHSSSQSSKSSDNEHTPGSSNSKKKETRKRAESRRLALESDSDDESVGSKKINGKSKRTSMWLDSDSDSNILPGTNGTEKAVSIVRESDISSSSSNRRVLVEKTDDNSQNVDDSMRDGSTFLSTTNGEESSQGSILNRSSIKRKRSPHSSFDRSGKSDSPRKIVKNKKFVVNSSSSGDENNADTTLMSVEDDDDAPKTVASDNEEVNSVGTKPKRKRIVLESNSDSD